MMNFSDGTSFLPAWLVPSCWQYQFLTEHFAIALLNTYYNYSQSVILRFYAGVEHIWGKGTHLIVIIALIYCYWVFYYHRVDAFII